MRLARRRAVRTLGFVASLSAAWLVAASGCDGKTSESAAPVAEADFPLAVAHAICDRIGDCCARAHFPYDAAACVERRRKYNVADSPPGSGTWNAAQAGACVATFADEALHCSDVGYYNAYNEIGSCAGIYQGTKHPGESCDVNGDCAQSSEGYVWCEGATLPGICQLHKRPSGGEPCGIREGNGPEPAVVGACEDGESDAFTCSGTPGICVPYVPLGAPCNFTTKPCAASAYCDGATCLASRGVGEACPLGYECNAASRCVAGSCVAKLADGEDCKDWSDCLGGVCYGRCSTSGIVRPGVCNGTGP
jgi:hypothetical protein